jgi:hypothetical protein
MPMVPPTFGNVMALKSYKYMEQNNKVLRHSNIPFSLEINGVPY